MTTFFGHLDPRAIDLSRAGDDPDGDCLTNLDEYRAGMDPTVALSAQRVVDYEDDRLQWQAKPFELYQLESAQQPDRGISA